MMEDARRTAELAARVSYGRLVAILSACSGDIAGAEDALADAFVSAIRAWPARGIPDNPDAWLLAAARNAISNAIRHRKVQEAAATELIERSQHVSSERTTFPDERLKLLFVCAHPAIDEIARTPLMLQTVLGLDAARIAAAFLVAPAAMGQRLVRAKTKIRDAGIAFGVPETEQMPERLPDVLNAIYAAYGTGWDCIAGADEGTGSLANEAIYLSRLVATLLPEEPEAKGLLALMLYCEARRHARRCPAGNFVPLREQNYDLWSRDMITEAERLLVSASRSQTIGRFQCEAAIQSVHVQRAMTRVTNYDALRTLYNLLATHYPSVGVLVSRAAVIVESGDASAGLQALDLIAAERTVSYQPFWTTRGHALAALGRFHEAIQAAHLAIGLTEDQTIREYLGTVAQGWSTRADQLGSRRIAII